MNINGYQTSPLVSPSASTAYGSGISGVDDAEDAMNEVARAAKQNLLSIASQLRAVSGKLAQMEGGNKSSDRMKAQLGAQKDDLTQKLQVAMGEWSQAQQAQSNLQSKKDKTMDALVGNLR